MEGPVTSARRRRSQEALDTRVSLIPKAHKLVIGVVALLLLVVIAWGWLGSVPTTVRGDGILMPANDRLHIVSAAETGTIDSIAVQVGDTVAVDQILVTLSLTELEADLRSARQALQDAAESQSRRASQLGADLADLERVTERRLDLIEAATGDDTDNQDLALRLEASRVQMQLDDFRLRLSDQLEDDRRRVATLTAALAELETRHAAAGAVRSPMAGIVYQVPVSLGEVVRAGDRVVIVHRPISHLEVLAFLEPDHARLVTEGMAAHVAPTTIAQEEYGSLRGEVTYVAPHPLSQRSINAWLHNPELAERLTQAGGSYLARIALVADPDTPSGLQWWSGTGPPFAVSVGTLAAVDVVVAEQRPMALVLPVIQTLIGQ